MKHLSEIEKFIFKNDKPKKVDLIFTLGILNYRLHEYTASLYKKGYANKILVCGGFPLNKGRFEWEKIEEEKYRKPFITEAEYAKFVLIENGVPEEAIIIENKSKHTMENAIYAKEIINQNNIEVSTAMITCKAYHARRAFMTFSHVMPEIEFIVSPLKESVITEKNWLDSKKSAEKVLFELPKLYHYFHEDILKEIAKN